MSNENVRSLHSLWNNCKTDLGVVQQSYVCVPSLAREQRSEIEELVGRVLKLNIMEEDISTTTTSSTWSHRNVNEFPNEEELRQSIPIYQISNDIIQCDCVNFDDVYISSSDDDTDGEMISSEENDTTDDDDFISSEDDDDVVEAGNHSSDDDVVEAGSHSSSDDDDDVEAGNHSSDDDDVEDVYHSSSDDDTGGYDDDDDFTFQPKKPELQPESKVSDWLSGSAEQQTDINENIVLKDWYTDSDTENFEEASVKPDGWDVRSQPNSIRRLNFSHLLHSFEKPFPCQVTYVDTQLKFYVARKEGMALYDKMTKDLQEIAKKMKIEGMQLKNFVSGTPCIARYEEDDQYYRAVIACNGFDSASVVFIDYGNRAIVDYDDLLALPESLADLPAMAIECALDGVDSKQLNSSLVGPFQDDFYEGREVLVKAVCPVNLYDEYEIQWFVELFDYKTFELLNESYCSFSLKKNVILMKECVVYDDDDVDTLVDGDTLVDVDF